MDYELLPEEESSQEFSTKDVGRQIARTGTNLATRAVGLPGDIFSLINEYIASPATELISGKKGLPYEETYLGKVLPTTQQHRQNIESVTGDFLKPQNKSEQFLDDVIEDTALLLIPGSGAAKASQQLIKNQKTLKSFAKSLGANLAGESVSEGTGSKEAGEFTKGGLLFLSSLLDAPSVAQKIGNLYKEAEKNLPADASIKANSFYKNLDSLENKILQGRPKSNLSPSESFVLEEVKKAKNLIEDGKVNVKKLWAQKRSLNEELSSKKIFEMDAKSRRGAKLLAKNITNFYNQAIGEYGKKNPRFYTPFKSADDAFGTMAQSQFFSNFVKNNATNPATKGLLNLFGVSVAPLGAPLYYTARLGYRIMNSPTLRKIYGDAVKAAAKENASVFNKNLKKLDDALQEEESLDRFEFVE